MAERKKRGKRLPVKVGRKERGLAEREYPWRPFDILDRMEREFEDFRRYLSDFFLPKRRPGEYMVEREPACDVVEKPDKIVVTAEMPGIPKEEIDIAVSENSIEIKGEVEKKEEEKEEGYLRRERSYASFYRCMDLPAEIIPEKVDAKLDHGVLEITIPKKEATPKKKLHKVKIK